MEPVNEPVRKAPVFERKKAGRVSPKRILFHVFTATLAVLLLYPVIWFPGCCNRKNPLGRLCRQGCRPGNGC
ncbi:putative ABC transporter permease protein YesQ [Bacillus subtilis subsp. subtilis]|nr:putative ABC transporter permease protein YesQ [Bacillus subtilis subsp. subtilis]POD83654.1 putative ABC transporter permease protein YesQ [Bacillus subtilis subsp. subtilis]